MFNNDRHYKKYIEYKKTKLYCFYSEKVITFKHSEQIYLSIFKFNRKLMCRYKAQLTK